MARFNIADIDYSKDDYIDTNNKLFRRGRNNMGKTVEGIDSLDSDAKAQGEKNLEVYGSELINNLKQINYTYEQINSRLVKEIQSKKLKVDMSGFPKPPDGKGKKGKKEIKPEPTLPDDSEALPDDSEALPDLSTPDFMKYRIKGLTELGEYSITELTSESYENDA